MTSMYERTIQFLGEQSMEQLSKSTVVVFGLGGVGGTALEALCRTGIGHLVIVDFDKVDITNLNRQILYNKDDIGMFKTTVAKQKSLKITENCEVIDINSRVSEEILDYDLVKNADYWIDAIDDIKAKKLLIDKSIEYEIPLIISLGMGNRFDSSNVCVTTLNKTDGDPLARRLRHDLRKDGVDISRIQCVYSRDLPTIKHTPPTSLIFCPSIAGLKMAQKVVEDLIK